MKRILLGLSGILCSAGAMTQAVTDTVSIGAGYANQVWYSLENGIMASAAKSEWDLAFEAMGFNTTIRLNGVTGNALWVYPHGDTADWDNIDTSGMNAWPQLYDSDTSWALGAFNVNADPQNSFDLGWGIYNLSTHHVTGDSIYILKTPNGDFKKLWMVSLANGVYTFRLAGLDGNNAIERTLNKGDFPDKGFAYYSIANDESLDREPITQTWDLLFTQYAALIPGFGGYPSTGILQNAGVSAAKVYPVNDPATYPDHGSATFETRINTIGYGWKSFDFTTNDWLVADSTVYFVKALNGDIWKLVMQDFGGSASGDYIFSKELVMQGTGIGTPANGSAFFLYPTPATGQVTVVHDAKHSGARLAVYTMNGALVKTCTLKGGAFPGHLLDISDLEAGIYLVEVRSQNTTATQKLIVQ